MYYYQFNLRDYLARTRHLSPQEDLAYRRMLDAYYTEEGPLPIEPARVARLIALPDMEAEVRLVLDEFFDLTDEGWRNGRCDEEIAKFHSKSTKAKAAAGTRWTAKKDADAMQTHSERTAVAMPTNNHKPKTNTTPTPSKGFDVFWAAYPRKDAKANAIRAWDKLSPSDELIETIVTHVKARAQTDKWKEQGGAFVPHAATFINQQRWTDPLQVGAESFWETLK